MVPDLRNRAADHVKHQLRASVKKQGILQRLFIRFQVSGQNIGHFHNTLR